MLCWSIEHLVTLPSNVFLFMRSFCDDVEDYFVNYQMDENEYPTPPSFFIKSKPCDILGLSLLLEVALLFAFDFLDFLILPTQPLSFSPSGNFGYLSDKHVLLIVLYEAFLFIKIHKERAMFSLLLVDLIANR